MILCVHHKRIDLEDLCHAYYTLETLKKTYNEVVQSLPEAGQDPKKRDVIIVPLNLKTSVGRLRKNE
jgi:hypothetical protein